MARNAFYSFHYKPDNWRVSQVRNMGAVDGTGLVSDNDWEAVEKGGDPAIERWIAAQMKGCSCTIVLVGENTAGRKWITYEIKKSWEAGMGVVGICVHNLLNRLGENSAKGANPFDELTLDGKNLSTIVKLYDPPYSVSTSVYEHIKKNMADWVEEAITIRNKYN